MRAPDFDTLARELEAIGAAPSIISRTRQELSDHYADIRAAALAAGLSHAAARREAAKSIGSLDIIVAAVAARPNLLDWRHRWPKAAIYVDSLTYCLLWPATPFVYCATHPAGIVRWSLSSSLAVCVTGSLLLGLQWLLKTTTGI
jgi:hypothetical protein